MSTNLIICTYGAKYGCIDKNNYLRKTLSVLNNIKHSLDRITIMKPKLDDRHIPYSNYYNMDDINIANIKDIIKIVDCENTGISYGQFLTGVYSDLNFDYYIFIEDDYIPFIDDFDAYLKRKCSLESYLCIFYYKDKLWRMNDHMYKISCHREFTEKLNDNFIVPDHSCGVISRYAVQKIKNKYDNINKLLKLFDFNFNISMLWLHQFIFGYLLYICDVKISDLSDNLALFYETGKNVKTCYGNSCSYIKDLKIDKLLDHPVFTPHEFVEDYSFKLEDYKDYIKNYEEFIQKYNWLKNQ